ncbi:MAG: response regulator [Bacteriovoracaceae bacterium]
MSKIENKLKKKILIVDDEPLIRDLIRDQLSEFSDDIFDCDDGVKALELLKKEAFDVVLTDIKMPNMDGIEFIQILSELGIIVPVIILTGFSDKEVTKLAWQRGAFDLLDKPIDFDLLKRSVEKALAHGRQINFAKDFYQKKYYTPFTIAFEKEEFDKIKKQCHKNSISISSYIYGIIKKQLDQEFK